MAIVGAVCDILSKFSVDIDTECVLEGPGLDSAFCLDSMAIVGAVCDVLSKFSLFEGAMPSQDFLTEWGRTNIP